MFKFLRRCLMPKKDYSQTPVPGNCPVCRFSVFGTRIVRLAVRDWTTDPLRCRWWCHNCNSFFTWEASDRIVSNIETHFKRGLLGNVDVDAINRGMGVNWIDPKLPDEFDPPGYDHSRNFEE
jgi:hypothetical protein